MRSLKVGGRATEWAEAISNEWIPLHRTCLPETVVIFRLRCCRRSKPGGIVTQSGLHRCRSASLSHSSHELAARGESIQIGSHGDTLATLVSEAHLQSDASKVFDLTQVGVPRLLFALLSQRFTGRLELGQPAPHAGHRVITFRGGLPRRCDWQVPGTQIGQVLIEQEALDRETLARSLEFLDPDKRLGRQLVEQGSIDEDQLSRALRVQCERRLVDLCSADEGEVLVTSSSTEDDDDYPDARTLWVIGRGVQQHVDASRIEAELGDKLQQRVRTISGFDRYRSQFEFDRAHERALTLLARSHGATAAEIAERTELEEVQAKQLVYLLGICKMLAAGQNVASAEPADSAVSMVRGVPPIRDERSEDEPAAVARKVTSSVSSGAEPAAVLGVEDDADLRAIDRAARSLLDRLVLDARTEQDQEIVGQARNAVERVRDACRERRQQYVDAHAPRLLRERNWARALPLFEDRLQLTPNDPPTRAVLAWLRYQTSTKSPREVQRALDALNRITSQQPQLGDAHYYKGLLLVERDDTARAIRAFQTAAELDPKNIDAERHARILRAGGKLPEPEKPAPSAAVPQFKPKKRKQGPRSHYWSGPWPAIWVVTGLLLTALIAAQIVLRLDADF